MEYLKIIGLFCIFCIIQYISLLLWKLTENKLQIRATDKKIDAIYLKVLHIIKARTGSTPGTQPEPTENKVN